VLGVSGPSANRFGRVSPTTAQHVASEFDPGLLILDGGPCPVGIESSIVDCTREVPVLLRPGMLSQAQLSLACGQTVLTQAAYEGNDAVGSAPRASGMLASHYAPNAKVRLLSLLAMQQARPGPGLKIGIWARSPISQLPQGAFVRVMPNDPQPCARALFAQLREFEALGVAEIWVELPPVTAEWDGIRDRLARAAVPTQAQADTSSLN